MEYPTEEYVSELILKGSSLYQLYEKFNINDIQHEYFNHCKLWKSLYTAHRGLNELCAMFSRNISELPTLLHNESKTERCRYLYFWIYDQIKKNFKSNYVPINKRPRIIRSYFSVASQMKKTLSNIHCDFIYNQYITIDLWKKWKDLYDYIKNKNYIEQIINSDPKLCEIYQKYHTYIKGIYETYKVECCSENYIKSPVSHLNFKEWCNNGDILTELQCNKNSGVLLSSEESDQVSVTKPGIADREATIEGQENARTVGSTGLGPNEETPGHPLAEDIHKENGHREPVVPEMLQTEGEGGLKGDSVMVTPIEGNTLEAVIPNNVSTIGATVAGSSLFIIMMYKYTPLGSWVSTRILGRNKLIKNMRKNNYDLLLNDAGNRETSLNDPMYHIRYNSSTNNEFILD